MMFKCNSKNCHSEGKHCSSSRLCIFGIAIAAGMVNGLGMLVLGWLATAYNFGVPIIHLMGTVYRGYAPNLEGVLMGSLWGFIDAFIAGLLFALVYNGIICLCKCCCRGCKKNNADIAEKP